GVVGGHFHNAVGAGHRGAHPGVEGHRRCVAGDDMYRAAAKGANAPDGTILHGVGNPALQVLAPDGFVHLLQHPVPVEHVAAGIAVERFEHTAGNAGGVAAQLEGLAQIVVFVDIQHSPQLLKEVGDVLDFHILVAGHGIHGAAGEAVQVLVDVWGGEADAALAAAKIQAVVVDDLTANNKGYFEGFHGFGSRMLGVGYRSTVVRCHQAFSAARIKNSMAFSWASGAPEQEILSSLPFLSLKRRISWWIYS